MKKRIFAESNSRKYKVLLVLLGAILNATMAYISKQINMPVYLDTVGTIVVSCIAGPLAGAMTGILTNSLCLFFNTMSMYFAFINVIIAFLAAIYSRRYSDRGSRYKLLFALTLGVVSGLLSNYIQWHLLQDAQSDYVISAAMDTAKFEGLPYWANYFIVNLIVNILDKGLAVGISLNIIYIFPKKIMEMCIYDDWKQKPLSKDEIDNMKKWGSGNTFSMRTRLAGLIIAVVFLIIVVMSVVEIQLYFYQDIDRKEKSTLAIAKMAAEKIDGDKIEYYLKYGKDAEGYKEVEDFLYQLRDTTTEIMYLYVAKVDDEKITYIFDLDARDEYQGYGLIDDTYGFVPGDTELIDDSFVPYLDDFKVGDHPITFDSEGQYRWITSTYYPIHNSDGDLVCYVGADASIDYVMDYSKRFAWRTLMDLSDFICIVVVYEIWFTTVYMVYPINSIGLGIENVINAGDDQEQIDQAVKDLRKINVRTNDEIEKLYKSICDMALNQAEQLRRIRRFSDSTHKMQDGLIMTMAGLVEKGEDFDFHVQITSSYVKIIVEGLYKKEYYPGKVTPKFISDIVRSAPLHDIGKIFVPDDILNKKGNLTQEETEIKQSHTTAGKKILDDAISTSSGDNYLKEARNMAVYHHERWDGKGYPDGMHGEVIPLSARIMAVADYFDELTSGNVDGKEYSFEEAVLKIQEGSGTLFDPKCVEAFMESLPEIKVIYRKYSRN